MYQVKLRVFEGPFDLLLHLIGRQELDIYDIPLARITEEYLNYLRQMDDLNLERASEFLLIAAALIEIKAEALLPQEKEPEEEAISPAQARELLIARLIEYKKFKNAALALAGRAESQGRTYPREASLEEKFARLQPDFLQETTLEDLARIYLELEARKSPVISSSHITPIEVSVAEKIEEVLGMLKSRPQTTFRDLTRHCSSKIEVIVTFLVLLELYKTGLVAFNQAETFGEIEVSFKEAEEDECSGGLQASICKPKGFRYYSSARL